MTRGKIAIITPEGKILTSIEFNGDMYFTSGHGEKVFAEFLTVETENEYMSLVERFNANTFRYDEDLFFYLPDSCFDLQEDYFGKWFSDYIYIKNLSEDQYDFLDGNGKLINCLPGEQLVFNYGRYFGRSAEECYSRDVFDELDYFQQVLSNDNEYNYLKLRQLCSKFDEKIGKDTLNKIIDNYDFVYGETLDFILTEQTKDINRLFYFMKGVKHVKDNIYILDGNGNLRNVEQNDFECLISDLKDKINLELSPSFQKKDYAMG